MSKQMSFLPEPPIQAVLPPPHTLAYKALRMLLEGRPLSHPDFQEKTASWRLAAHIYRLKKMGWPIERMGEGYSPDDAYQVRHIGKYYIDEDLLEAARKLFI
jgi:hypothetical protein